MSGIAGAVEAPAGRIALLGIGGAKRSFAGGFAPAAPDSSVRGLRIRSPGCPAMRLAMKVRGIPPDGDALESFAMEPAIFSPVTADQAVASVRVAEGLVAGNVWLVGNSGPPRARRYTTERREVGTPGLPSDIAKATVAWQERFGSVNPTLGAGEKEARAGLAMAPLRRLGDPSP